VANYDRQVTVEEVVDEGKIEKVEDFDINQHSAFIEKMEAQELFKDDLDETQVRNLANYFVLLPSEVALKLWSAIGTASQDTLTALHQSDTDAGITCGAHLAKILTGDQ